MKNFVSSGDVIRLTAPAAVLSGGVVKVGQAIGVAGNAAANGEDVEVYLTGVYDLPKNAAEAIAAGACVYWDAAGGEVTATAAGNTPLGGATVAALAADATVRVRLNGAIVPANA